jgi:hypothetical protein
VIGDWDAFSGIAGEILEELAAAQSPITDH